MSGMSAPKLEVVAQAEAWAKNSLLFYPELHVQIPGEFVQPGRDRIQPGLASRIAAAYRISMAQSHGAGASVWSRFSENAREIHDSLLSGNLDRIVAILEDPIPTQLFIGYYSVIRDFGLDESADELAKLRGWTVHQTLECFVRLAQAAGATLLWNPERVEQSRGEGADFTAACLENLLARVDEAVGVRVDFPNPIQREFGLPTVRGIASYRAPHAIYQAWRVRELLGKSSEKRVVEVGAGMGRTAYYARLLGVKEFTIVDLPLGNVAQANFLGRALGPDAIWLPGDPVSDQAGRIRICPSEWLASSDELFDVVLNADSITEMDRRHAIDYVGWAGRCATTFLSINHEANLFSARNLCAKFNTRTRILRYPYWLRKGYVEEVVCFER